MKYCGIDPSLTGTGMALINRRNKLLAFKHLKIKAKPGFQHIRELRKEVRKIIIAWEPDHVFIEAPIVFPGRAKGMMRTFYFHALIRDLLIRLDIPWTEFPPPYIKRNFTGKGNADKEMMLRHARRRTKNKIPNHDVADAYAAAFVGIAQLLT